MSPEQQGEPACREGDHHRQQRILGALCGARAGAQPHRPVVGKDNPGYVPDDDGGCWGGCEGAIVRWINSLRCGC